jgi:ABC-type branched-subunit amino acid transport system ATPase component
LDLALFPAFKRFWVLPAGVLSGGQEQMLSVARAIVEPRRLILWSTNRPGGSRRASSRT